MTQPIAISIVTPCYNGAGFLRTTIASVLAQTVPALEMIVIDDGSTDDSASIAESFGPPVRVIRQANQGESVARNRGLREARGTHVLFLDADDLLRDRALESLVKAAGERPNAVALMGRSFFKDNPQHAVEAPPPIWEDFFPWIIGENFGPPHCYLPPIDLVRRAGGFCESLRWFEDWDLWWRVGLLGGHLVTVQYPGALYRQHAKSQLATTKLADRARGHASVMERMAKAILEHPPLFAEHSELLFWNCWTSLRRAYAVGVPWQELRPFGDCIRRIAVEAPPPTSRSRLALTMRFLGTRAAAGIAQRLSPVRIEPAPGSAA